MKKFTIGPAATLLAVVQAAYFRQQAARALSDKSPRAGDDATGDDAAEKYGLQHTPGPYQGRTSTLLRAMRARRIWNGERPLKYYVPTRRERKEAQRAAKRSLVPD